MDKYLLADIEIFRDALPEIIANKKRDLLPKEAYLTKALSDWEHVAKGRARHETEGKTKEHREFLWNVISKLSNMDAKRELAQVRAELDRILFIERALSGSSMPIDFERMKQIPISTFYSGDLKTKGNKSWGRCPFHKEKTPSFTIDGNNRFICFGCGKKGDVIDFYMMLNNVEIKEAIKSLVRFI